MSQHPQIATMLRRASQNIERVASIHVKDLNLTYRQMLVLVAVHKQPGCRQCDITKVISIDRTTVTYILRHLEENGLVVQVRHQDDGRSVSVTCTDKGARLAKEGALALDKFEVDIRRLVQTEHRSVERAMTKLMEARANDQDGGEEEDRAPKRIRPAKKIVRKRARSRASA